MIKIKGKGYNLRFDLGAMEEVEEQFGSLKEMFESVKDGKVKPLKKLLLIMLNAALDYEGKDERLTADDIKHMPYSVLTMVRPTLEQAMHAETIDGGEADDDVHDGYLEAIDREEKKD